MFFVKRVSEAGRLLVEADMTFALSNVGGAHMATNLKEMMDAANAAVQLCR